MSVDGVNIGLLVLRLVVGLLWCGHGAQKLLGWFGAKQRGTLEEEFSHFGYHPPLLFGRLAGTTELTGGLLLASGLLTPIGAGLLACVAVQATAAVKWQNGCWIQDDGYEYLAVLAAVGVAFAFVGAGELSLDHALGTGFAGVTAGIVVAVVAALTPLLPRRIGAAAATASEHGEA